MNNKEKTGTIKWERKFENNETISIWRYSSKISYSNPYEVEIIYKNEPETKKRKKTKPK